MKKSISTAIGTELLFENERIRLWDMVLRPGETSALHRHEKDYVYVYLAPSRITVERPGLAPATDAYDNGYVQYTEVGVGVEHQIRNSGNTVHRQIIVEFMEPSRSATPQTPQSNGRRQDA
jgi:hypothetical protein